MKPKVKFVLLSTLLGSLLYFVLSLVVTFIDLQINGEGPHGYGVFMYLVMPLYLTPVGFLTGLITSLCLKAPNYKKLSLILGGVFVAVVAGTYLLLKGYVWFSQD